MYSFRPPRNEFANPPSRLEERPSQSDDLVSREDVVAIDLGIDNTERINTRQ